MSTAVGRGTEPCETPATSAENSVWCQISAGVSLEDEGIAADGVARPGSETLVCTGKGCFVSRHECRIGARRRTNA